MVFEFQTVSVCPQPAWPLLSRSNISSAFWAVLKAGIVKAQNFKEAYTPLVLSPIINTYIFTIYLLHTFICTAPQSDFRSSVIRIKIKLLYYKSTLLEKNKGYYSLIS